jgi:hypothetical protein
MNSESYAQLQSLESHLKPSTWLTGGDEEEVVKDFSIFEELLKQTRLAIGPIFSTLDESACLVQMIICVSPRYNFNRVNSRASHLKAAWTSGGTKEGPFCLMNSVTICGQVRPSVSKDIVPSKTASAGKQYQRPGKR